MLSVLNVLTFFYVRVHSLTDWRQEFLCSRTTAMEQPTDRDPEERHYVGTL